MLLERCHPADPLPFPICAEGQQDGHSVYRLLSDRAFYPQAHFYLILVYLFPHIAQICLSFNTFYSILRMVNTVSVRLRRDLWRQAKMYAASHDIKVVDAVADLVHSGLQVLEGKD